jgi:hypothetical protein
VDDDQFAVRNHSMLRWNQWIIRKAIILYWLVTQIPASSLILSRRLAGCKGIRPMKVKEELE